MEPLTPPLPPPPARYTLHREAGVWVVRDHEAGNQRTFSSTGDLEQHLENLGLATIHFQVGAQWWPLAVAPGDLSGDLDEVVR